MQGQLVVGDRAFIQGQAHAVGGPLGIGEIFRERRADELLPAVTRHAAHGLVDVGDVQVRIDRDEAVQGGLDEAPVIGPLFRELGLQAGLLGDVAGAGEDAVDVAGGIFEDRGVEGDHQSLSVPGGQGEDVVGDHALFEGLFHPGVGAVAVHEIVDKRRADQLLPGVARHAGTCGR